MNAGVNIRYIKYISQEMKELAGQASGLLEEIEDVERELQKQPVMRSCLRSLDRVRDDMEEERYKISLLAQSLANIGMQYRRAERKIEDSLEEKRPAPNRAGAGNIDLSQLSENLNLLLYGGETDGGHK